MLLRLPQLQRVQEQVLVLLLQLLDWLPPVD
jgi:hypothetical protein